MKAYPENTDLSFEVTPVDADGKAYEDECSLKYELTGVDGKNVCSGELGAKPFKIDIRAKFNVISDDKATDIRFLKVGFYRPDGSLISQQKTEYLLQGENPLTVGKNSFVTLEQSKLLTATIPGLEYAEKANDTQWVNALTESYERISRLRFRIGVVNSRMENVGYISEIADRPRAITDADPFDLLHSSFHLDDLSEDEFGRLPEKFRKALAKAQIIESNAVLAPTDTIEERRRKGVILETINEVKMMFSSTTPIKNSVSNKTLSILLPWLDNSIRIRRV